MPYYMRHENNYDFRYIRNHVTSINGNNLMTCASNVKVDRGIPGEPILYLSGKYHIWDEHTRSSQITCSEFKSI